MKKLFFMCAMICAIFLTGCKNASDSKCSYTPAHNSALLESRERLIREYIMIEIGGASDALTLDEIFINALNNSDPSIRACAALALGTLKSEDAIKALIAKSSDEHWMVRDAVVRALGRIGSEKALPILIDRLKNDKHLFVQVDAAEALANINTPSSWASLNNVSENTHWLIRDTISRAKLLSSSR